MKVYYTVKEASKLVGVKPHILRYWEQKIPLLKPIRRRNRRFYTTEDIKVALVVRYLLDNGYSLRGIAQKLKEKEVESLFPLAWLNHSNEILKDLRELLAKVEKLRNFFGGRGNPLALR